MNWKELAGEIHQNAERHGFWPEEKSEQEVIALIHTEWSEAVQAEREGEPLVWFSCDCSGGNDEATLRDCSDCSDWRGPDREELEPCADENCRIWPQGETDSDCMWIWETQTCAANRRKPEGVATELLDGCIRTLDACAAWGVEVPEENPYRGELEEIIPQWRLTTLVCWLHKFTDELWLGSSEARANAAAHILWMVFSWIHGKVINPEELMRKKMRFNEDRPWKHNRKY